MRPLAPGMPAPAALASLPHAELIALALRTVTLAPAQLARALGVTTDAIRRSHRAPTTLPLPQRLTLAALAGAEPGAAPVARELRRRTIQAMSKRSHLLGGVQADG